jgi:hypothetical protein
MTPVALAQGVSIFSVAVLRDAAALRRLLRTNG